MDITELLEDDSDLYGYTKMSKNQFIYHMLKLYGNMNPAAGVEKSKEENAPPPRYDLVPETILKNVPFWAFDMLTKPKDVEILERLACSSLFHEHLMAGVDEKHIPLNNLTKFHTYSKDFENGGNIVAKRSKTQDNGSLANHIANTSYLSCMLANGDRACFDNAACLQPKEAEIMPARIALNAKISSDWNAYYIHSKKTSDAVMEVAALKETVDSARRFDENKCIYLLSPSDVPFLVTPEQQIGKERYNGVILMPYHQ